MSCQFPMVKALSRHCKNICIAMPCPCYSCCSSVRSKQTQMHTIELDVTRHVHLFSGVSSWMCQDLVCSFKELQLKNCSRVHYSMMYHCVIIGLFVIDIDRYAPSSHRARGSSLKIQLKMLPALPMRFILRMPGAHWGMDRTYWTEEVVAMGRVWIRFLACKPARYIVMSCAFSGWR